MSGSGISIPSVDSSRGMLMVVSTSPVQFSLLRRFTDDGTDRPYVVCVEVGLDGG